MILLTLCLLASLTGDACLQVRDAQAIAWVANLRTARTQVLIPLSADSESTARAVPSARGLELFVAAPEEAALELKSLRVSALAHREGERILLFEGIAQRVWQEVLPRDIRLENGRSCLGLLSREDRVGVEHGVVRVEAAEGGRELLLLPLPTGEAEASIEVRPAGGVWSTKTWKSQQGHALRLAGEVAWELRAASCGLDRVFCARVEPLPPSATEVVSVRQSHVEQVERRVAAGEVWPAVFPFPQASAPGQTLTLLVEVELEPGTLPAPSEPNLDPLPTPLFRDVTALAGLCDVHLEGPAQQLDIRPTMGPGAAWGDFDGDGWIDLYVVQGSGRAQSASPTNRLMRNRGDGTFEEWPGAQDTGAGMGALFFDLEGDGDLDLYVANYGPDALYRNDGEAGFVDVSQAHDLARSAWSAGVCAADYDGDGDLDLYVASYLVYDPNLKGVPQDLPGYAREDPTQMLPFAFAGAANTFLENVNGKLVDRTTELGLADEQGRGMQPVFWDFDLDGDEDLYIANDVSMNVLYRNEGDGSFRDISFQVGMDDPRGGMGVATGDVDGDGDLDLFLTNWELEANALYRNNVISAHRRKSHSGTFQDVTVHSRLGRDSFGKTSWGAVFFDADNDGDLDLFVPNGYTSPDYESTGICVGQPNQFFLNDGEGRFVDHSERAGAALAEARASRAAALCDYDRDGRLDLFITNNNGPYQLLHNEIDSGLHWLGVELRGRGANSAAIGARAWLALEGRTLMRHVSAGGGYLAGHAPGLHFGLGSATSAGELRVLWPSGRESLHVIDELDRWITIAEPPAPARDEAPSSDQDG